MASPFEILTTAAAAWNNVIVAENPDLSKNAQAALITGVNAAADSVANDFAGAITAEFVAGLVVGATMQSAVTKQFANPIVSVLSSAIGGNDALTHLPLMVASCLAARILDGTIDPSPTTERPPS